jgi:hypothetical protein
LLKKSDRTAQLADHRRWGLFVDTPHLKSFEIFREKSAEFVIRAGQKWFFNVLLEQDDFGRNRLKSESCSNFKSVEPDQAFGSVPSKAIRL